MKRLCGKTLLENNIHEEKILKEDDKNKTQEDKNMVKDHLPRLGNCEVCAATEARYTCPKCEVKTCCLRCLNIHKKELECDGIRDRTKFITLRNITETDFMNDYYFLEECNRYVQHRKTDICKRYTRYNRDLPIHLNRLRQAAKERKIQLKFLLQNFTKHRENTTFFNWKEKRIWWRVKWVFIDAGNLTYIDERCDEQHMLRDLLDKYVNIKNVEPVPEKKKLNSYHAKGLQNIKVLLKAEGIKRCNERFYLLDINQTLQNNLKNKILVEYPLIYVTYTDHLYDFDIIKDDEDVNEETKVYCQQLNQQYKAELEKQLKQLQEHDSNDDDDDESVGEENKNWVELKKERCTKKEKEERKRKRDEYEKSCTNFLFTDEKLLEILSSSSEEEV